MDGKAITPNSLASEDQEQKPPTSYDSLEFSLKGMSLTYQFKIWESSEEYVSVLIKDGSEILPCLKVGETIKTTCYTTRPVYTPENLDLRVQHITKNEQGRLKGHYLVGLEILLPNDS